MTQVSTLGKLAVVTAGAPGNRNRVRFDIDARRIILGLLIEREDRRVGDAVG